MLSHSCVPNTSMVVIKDRLLLHASADVPAGAPLTRNTIGTQITAPLAERWAAIAEMEGDDADEEDASEANSTSDAIEILLQAGGSSSAADEPLDAAASAELSIQNGSSSASSSDVLHSDVSTKAGKRARCGCRRCVVEGSVSEAVIEALSVCRQWYLGEATELWTAVQEAPEEEEEDSPQSGEHQCASLWSPRAFGSQFTTTQQGSVVM